MKTAEELIELALPSVLEGLRKEMAGSIDWQVKQTAAEQVSKHVSTWVTENVIPEITRKLIEEKDNLISLGTALGPQVVEALSAAFLEELKKNLSSSCKRSVMFKAMFE